MESRSKAQKKANTITIQAEFIIWYIGKTWAHAERKRVNRCQRSATMNASKVSKQAQWFLPIFLFKFEILVRRPRLKHNDEEDEEDREKLSARSNFETNQQGHKGGACR